MALAPVPRTMIHISDALWANLPKHAGPLSMAALIIALHSLYIGGYRFRVDASYIAVGRVASVVMCLTLVLLVFEVTDSAQHPTILIAFECLSAGVWTIYAYCIFTGMGWGHSSTSAGKLAGSDPRRGGWWCVLRRLMLPFFREAVLVSMGLPCFLLIKAGLDSDFLSVTLLTLSEVVLIPLVCISMVPRLWNWYTPHFKHVGLTIGRYINIIGGVIILFGAHLRRDTWGRELAALQVEIGTIPRTYAPVHTHTRVVLGQGRGRGGGGAEDTTKA